MGEAFVSDMGGGQTVVQRRTLADDATGKRIRFGNGISNPIPIGDPR